MNTLDLFEQRGRKRQQEWAPLAARMRPLTFDEFLGQEHIVGTGKVLRLAIEADQLPSLILWGPPGSGKTTLAYLISKLTNSCFESVSAVDSGVADLRRVVQQAKEGLALQDRRTILFVDEIHRFNKSQQDVVLPYVEDGTITLIGATTENPSFVVIAPLLSRSRVVALEQLSEKQIDAIIQRAIGDSERGLGILKVELETDAAEFLINMANGDARVALNVLEIVSGATKPDDQGVRRVALETVEDALQRRVALYDKSGDRHYDTISAFIKSVRGSDPDAALYWLGRMVEAGEDVLFIARRLIVLAAEDIGLAEPSALATAIAAQQAVHFLGMPEGRIPLAEATVYLATCPKSNSAFAALNRAMEDVRNTLQEPVPLHLRNPVDKVTRGMGYGKGYKYSHSYKENFVQQEYLPPSLKGRRYYEPTDQGVEKGIAERLRNWRDHQERQR